MTEESARASTEGQIGLLERAITYTLGSLHLVTAESLDRQTPCREWNLRDLLAHMNDALVALQEAVTAGTVDLDVARPPTDPVAVLRSRACRLLGEWAGCDGPELITISGLPVATDMIVGAGALEVAVHGWDVAAGCGIRRDFPAPLAEELLELAPVLITAADRPERFGAVLPVAPHAGAGERLLAFMGRDLGRNPHGLPPVGW